jgi:Intrinsic membrane protein PufX
MAERPFYVIRDDDPREVLRTWILMQMLRGAGYAAVVVFGAGLIMYALYLFGLLLPPESKEAPPPKLSQLSAPAEAAELA